MNERAARVRTVLLAAVAGAGLLLTSCGDSGTTAESTTTTTSAPMPAEFSGYVRSPALDVSSVTLPAVDGTPVAMAADPGDLRLVYFGYTFCPDVCPATMSFVKATMENLPEEDRERVEVDMITVDPRRDTPEKLQEYVTNFVPSGTAIRTEDRTLLYGSADAFGADFKASINAEGVREISHTADLYVVDDTGTVILTWPFGTAQADIERDLVRLLAGERPDTEPAADPPAGGGEEDR
ncbi:MAG: SCO family protein [Microthrixaceae bacterium]|nr:SCO family protein [Microthrixaceae bacterium]